MAMEASTHSRVTKAELFDLFNRARATGWQIEPLGLHEAMLRHPDGRQFHLHARGQGKGKKRVPPNRERFRETILRQEAANV